MLLYGIDTPGMAILVYRRGKGAEKRKKEGGERKGNRGEGRGGKGKEKRGGNKRGGICLMALGGWTPGRLNPGRQHVSCHGPRAKVYTQDRIKHR